MIYKLPFEKLEIYNLSVELAVDVYSLTKSWPSEEKFGMISQIRRASTSIGANIAEGVSRFSNKEKARFIEIAFGSTMEVIHFLNLAVRFDYIDSATLEKMKLQSLELSNKINAFHKRLRT